MKKILIGLAILMSVSLVGCERMKNVDWKFWERWEKTKSVEVVVTNITQGTYLTPILAVGHDTRQETMFEYDKAVSAELQAVAEGGNIEPMAAIYEAEGGEVVRNPHGGLLGPGQSTTFTLSPENTRLSLVAMILPTNDGFVALDNIVLREGQQYLYAIDAGTEGNDEQITGGGAPNTPGIPADPGGKANSEAPGIAGVSPEGSVGRHLGIAGGEGSALDPEVYGWESAIAIVKVTMNSN